MSTSFDAGPRPALFCALTLALYFPPLRSFTCNLSNAVSSVSIVLGEFHGSPLTMYCIMYFLTAEPPFSAGGSQ